MLSAAGTWPRAAASMQARLVRQQQLLESPGAYRAMWERQAHGPTRSLAAPQRALGARRQASSKTARSTGFPTACQILGGTHGLFACASKRATALHATVGTAASTAAASAPPDPAAAGTRGHGSARQQSTPLVDAVRRRGDAAHEVPFHVPGHKVRVAVARGTCLSGCPAMPCARCYGAAAALSAKTQA